MAIFWILRRAVGFRVSAGFENGLFLSAK